MSAVRAACRGEAVGEDATRQVAAEFPLYVRRHALRVPVVFTRECEMGLQVLLDDLVKGGLLGTATAIGSRATSRWFDGHVGFRVPSCS